MTGGEVSLCDGGGVLTIGLYGWDVEFESAVNGVG